MHLISVGFINVGMLAILFVHLQLTLYDIFF